MTSIWPFMFTEGKTDYAILSATYDFLLVFYNRYSAISRKTSLPVDDLDLTSQGH